MKKHKLRKNFEFRAVYTRGKSFSNKYLVLYVFKNYKNLPDTYRVGVSVSKKVGKSVVRSRVKRLILESFRLNNAGMKNGYDLVFIARAVSNGSSYKEVEWSVKNLLQKAGLYNIEKNTD
jgi:ribonuclease P protein component